MTMPLGTNRLPLTPKGGVTTKLILQGRYEITRKLGAGGMSTVYLARDLHFGAVERLCAVKEMLNNAPDLQTRTLNLENFTREANILAGLNHTAIPKVYDYFTQNNKSFLVMEYIDGTDLEEVWARTRSPMTVNEVVNWALQLCDVFVYLHSQNPPIVFRDAKPSNIMLTNKDQRIVLIDFGIAKVFQAGPKGTMIGTEGYAPPEQYRGIAEPRGDLYALAATMHHLLSGRDPRLEAPFTFSERPIRASNPEVSQDLETVIMKALEYEIDKRYTDARSMLEAIRRAGGGTASTNSGTATARLTPAVTQKVNATAALPQSDMATTNLAESHVVIKPIWQFKCEDEVRSSPRIQGDFLYIGCYDHNLYAVNVRNGKFAWKYPTEGGISSSPFITPEAIYIGSEDYSLYALSPNNGKVLWIAPTKDAIRSSPRMAMGTVVVGSDDGAVYGFDANSGKVIWRFATMQAVRSSPLIVNENVVIGSDDGHLYAFGLRTGRTQWKYNAGRFVMSTPTFYEGLIVVGSGDWAVHAVDAKTGRSIWRTRTDGPIVSSPFVTDGVAYVGSGDGHMYALDMRSGRMIWKSNVGGQVVSSPTVANGVIYFGSEDGRLHALETIRGRSLWTFRTGGSVASSPYIKDGHVYVGSNDHNVYALPIA